MRRDVFQAIADPVRREIIEILSKNPMSVNAVAENFEVSRPAISKHQKILEECGLVSISKIGRERYYRIDPQQLVPAFMWIDQYRKLWESKLDNFEKYLDELKSEKQNT